MPEFAPHDGVGLLAAWVAGLTGSLHCAVMCGPLAGAVLPGRAAAGRLASAVGWHAGRLLAYATVGLLLGAVGRSAAVALANWVQPVLPWLMAAGFVAVAFEFGRRVPGGASLGRLVGRMAGIAHGLPPVARSVSLGAVTPFLPCGLLWGIFLVAVGAGSPLGGALVMTAFGLGSIPGLAAVQLGTAWGGRWPRLERALRVGVPLVAAAALVVRALGGGHAGHTAPMSPGMPSHP